MNFTRLVEVVAEEADVPREEAARTVRATLDVIARTVATGDRVAIANFGTWRPVDVPRRKVRNPQTGERVWVRAHRDVRFRVSPGFRALVAVKRATKDRKPLTTQKRPKTKAA